MRRRPPDSPRRAAVRGAALSLLLAPAAALAAWVDVSEPTGSTALPSRGQSGVVCAPNGDVYVAGGAGRLIIDGRRQFTLLGDVWRWREGGVFEDLTASSAFPMPPTIEAHLAADGEGRIYEFGGVQNAIDGTFSHQLYRYTPASNRWEDITPPHSPAGREDHGFVGDTQRHVLWLFGGVTADATQLNDLWAYDIVRGEWRAVPPSTADIPMPRELYDLAWDGHDALYLFGGYRDGVGYLNDFWRFDIPAARWTDLTAASGAAQIAPRSYNGLAVDGNGIVWMAGGYAAPAVLGGFYRYDPLAGHWDDVSERAAGLLPRVTYEMVYRPQDGALYVFGGTTLDPARPGAYATRADLWRADLHPHLTLAAPSAADTLAVRGDSLLLLTLAAEGESGRPLTYRWRADGRALACRDDTLRWRPRSNGVHRVTGFAVDGVYADSVVWTIDAREVPARSAHTAPHLTASDSGTPGVFRIRARFGATAPFSARVVDAAGRVAWRSALARAASASHSFDIDLRDLPRGLYFLEAQADTVIRRMRLLRLP